MTAQLPKNGKHIRIVKNNSVYDQCNSSLLYLDDSIYDDCFIEVVNDQNNEKKELNMSDTFTIGDTTYRIDLEAAEASGLIEKIEKIKDISHGDIVATKKFKCMVIKNKDKFRLVILDDNYTTLFSETSKQSLIDDMNAEFYTKIGNIKDFIN